MKTSDFYYELPKELIAQSPAKVRSQSRLLVYDRDSRKIEHRHFYDIAGYLNKGDVLVLNTTRVIPARLHGIRPETGGAMEFLLLKRLDENRYEALARPAKRAKPGSRYFISDELSVIVESDTETEGGKRICLEYKGILEEVLDRVGEMPLPPYITERASDKERYQTVYSRQSGSAAAPTAGLHFTPELLSELRSKGVIVAEVLLHVGLGTFRPVSVENVEEHHMHSEYYEVSESSASAINSARALGGRIIAVGTTSCRTLESVTDDNGIVHPGSGDTSIFITPGYRFKAVDALITNFHLPESTLLMLISAFATREDILSMYEVAVKERYSFFSFGDACLIL
ncbi:MAG: tRNA preQ1(34) S-adenosylmethionine ribosyltransferase-isomerase QueA [Clostridia bacterium]|nr:tRNA preQ1(34) S-adenosylmethionine ribosyltransferase-isomerase QueA [Clostridia bacterium]